MNEAQYALLGTLFGGALTFGVTWYTLWRKERRKDKEKALNSLMEIHEATATVRDSYHQQTIRYAVVLKDPANYMALKDKPLPDDTPTNKLERLICFEQPSLKPLWKKLHDAIHVWYYTLGEVNKKVREVGDDTAKLDQLKGKSAQEILEARNFIETCCTEIQEEAVRLSHKYR